jgi:hypothetical protein
MAGGGGVGRSGGWGTCGVGSGLLGGVEGVGLKGAIGGIFTAAGGAQLGALLLLSVVDATCRRWRCRQQQ